MSERVLITGGTGFIGRHLAQSFIADGIKPLVTARHVPDSSEEVEFAGLDVTDQEAIENLIRSRRPQNVIHLAGVTGRDDPTDETCNDINFLGTVNLLEALNKTSPERVILIGTAAEYGFQKTPFREDMPASPVSPYGISRAKAGEFALEMHAASGFPVTILRVFSAFGPGQPANSFLSQLVTNALLNRNFKMTDGKQVRDYVHIGDIVAAIRRSLFVKNSAGRILNIGSGHGTSLKDLASAVWHQCHADAELLEFGALPKSGDAKYDTQADITVAREVLGWAPDGSVLNEDGKPSDRLTDTVSAVEKTLQ